jgi:hypothetical protein
MSQLGADVDELEELSRAFTREAQRLETSVINIDSALRQVWWKGDDGTGFRSTWQATHAPNLRSAATTLAEQATIVARNRTEQVTASNGGGTGTGAPTTDPAPGGVDGSAAGGGGGGGSWGDDDGDVPADDANAPGTIGQEGVYKDEHDGTKYDTKYAAGDPMEETPDGLQEPDVRVNLAETSGETRVGLYRGVNGSATNEYAVASGSADYLAGAEASGNAQASLGADGLEVGVDGRAFAGAEASATGSVQSGIVSGTGTASVMVGAEAEGNADVTIGPDGISAGAGGSAFVGGKAEASGTLDVGGVNVGASGSVSYGLGVEASVDAEFSADRVGAQLDLGATLGIGAEFSVDLSINPSEVADNVGDFFSDMNPFSW